MTTKPSRVELRQGYEPGLIGRVTELHGRYYAQAWGSGSGFENLIGREFGEFIEQYDAQRDLALSAHIDGVLAGAIAIVGDKPEPGSAQLRFFIVDPSHHGRGAGKKLLYKALDWCCERGLARVFLWTVDNLPQSRRLYEKVGFRVVERCPDARYTVHCDNLKMELLLADYASCRTELR